MVNGAANTTIVCTRDNAGTWSFAQVQLPDGVNITRYASINSSGTIAFIGYLPSSNDSTIALQSSSSPLQQAVLAQPCDRIQIDAFIPQTYLWEPLIANLVPPHYYIDQGDSRKNPLDASLDTGNATFALKSPPNGYKIGQTLDITTSLNYDVDGTLEENTEKPYVEPSTEYDASVLVNGQIPPGAPTTKVKTGTPDTDTVKVSHPSPGVVVASLEFAVPNPLIVFQKLTPDIHYRATVTIDRSNPLLPRYTVTGTSCRFPAYEIYVNGQRIHKYDPVPKGRGPWGLTRFDRSFNHTGLLDK